MYVDRICRLAGTAIHILAIIVGAYSQAPIEPKPEARDISLEFGMCQII